MAAPASRTLKDLNGKWTMNKTLSDSPDPALALQGIGWLTRKAIGLASITLDIKEYEGVPSPPSEAAGPATHIEIEQLATAGVKGTTEKRCVDGEWREHGDWLFGRVRGRSNWIASAADVEDKFLAGGWLAGEGEASGPAGEGLLESYVESLDSDWTARQIWGFQTVEGERRYCRNIVVAKGAQRVEIRLVYDYLP
ncbi:hypothetical protein QBC33DRAFT_307894 [Phialemonium atrogriseum]|uniref:Lipocalin-like domain-containing protein n=1 Tax=Phialemonium atrogriseum TaxID=1093897 RepID=A0AAJ0C5S5_9PEZI|nr:uncharacterized protein QBC33DRAFT_307894 [Phialemonium atrogriseum]KAK1769982.1 hypothetical protein QBC33DRAFT_307894 [Phialemonium atrogriseum]